MKFFGKRPVDRFPTEEAWEEHKQQIWQEDKAVTDLVSVFQKATRLGLDPAADPNWLTKLPALLRKEE